MTAVRVEIDGAEIADEAQFHAALREASGVEWYGGGLDALFDLLVAAAEPPIAIVWTNAALSRAAIGERFDRIVAVILDAVGYRGSDAVSFRLES